LITLSDSRDFMIAAPLNPAYGRRIAITVRNSTKGAAGRADWVGWSGRLL